MRAYLAVYKSFKDCIFGLYIPFVRLMRREIHISYIKYASFKIGGVYDESIKK